MSAATKPHVLSLYRRGLRLTLSWAVQRSIWRPQAVRLRQLFEANRHVQDPRIISSLIRDTEVQLERWKHPDTYLPPNVPGGSKYERNIPPPILDPPPKFDNI